MTIRQYASSQAKYWELFVNNLRIIYKYVTETYSYLLSKPLHINSKAIEIIDKPFDALEIKVGRTSITKWKIEIFGMTNPKTGSTGCVEIGHPKDCSSPAELVYHIADAIQKGEAVDSGVANYLNPDNYDDDGNWIG